MDIVIEMLKFGKAKVTGFDQQNLRTHLTNLGFDLNNVNLNGTISLYFGQYFKNNTAVLNLYFMTPQGYFDLLNFEATEQSRKFAKQANCYAILALLISSILALASIIISLSYDTVKIEDKQFNKLLTKTITDKKLVIQKDTNNVIQRDTAK